MPSTQISLPILYTRLSKPSLKLSSAENIIGLDYPFKIKLVHTRLEYFWIVSNISHQNVYQMCWSICLVSATHYRTLEYVGCGASEVSALCSVQILNACIYCAQCIFQKQLFQQFDIAVCISINLTILTYRLVQFNEVLFIQPQHYICNYSCFIYRPYVHTP